MLRGEVEKGFHADGGVVGKEEGGLHTPRYHWSVVLGYNVGWVISGMWTFGKGRGLEGGNVQILRPSRVRKMPKNGEERIINVKGSGIVL